jgi:predicted PurR-regulated permease PerM
VSVRPLRVPRWIQLVGLPLGILALWTLGGLLQHTLEILIVASLIALLLNPLVHGLTRMRVPRGLAVLLVYLSVFAAIGAVITVIGSLAVQQVGDAARVIDHEVTVQVATGRTPADDQIDAFQLWLDRHSLGQIQVRSIGQKAVVRVRADISGYVKSAITIGETIASAVVTGIFRFVLVLVISIYMLLDGPRLARLMNRLFPPGEDGRELGREVQRALASYVRGQTLVSLLIGLSAGLAMEVYGLVGIWPAATNYALFFGLFVLAMETIPYIGPILGAVPPIVLAIIDKPITGLWVALAFLAIHQLEGHIVVPRVMGSALRSHPLMVIFGLLCGAEIWGIPGALMALPLLSVARAAWDFLRPRLVFEQWTAVGALAGAGLEGVSEAGPSDAVGSVPNPPCLPIGHADGPDI